MNGCARAHGSKFATVRVLRGAVTRYPEADLSDEQARTYLGQFGISNMLALEPLYILSGGQKSRVAIALMAYNNPHILVRLKHLTKAVGGKGTCLLLHCPRIAMETVARRYLFLSFIFGYLCIYEAALHLWPPVHLALWRAICH